MAEPAFFLVSLKCWKHPLISSNFYMIDNSSEYKSRQLEIFFQVIVKALLFRKFCEIGGL